MKEEPRIAKTKFPPLLSLTYILQQKADELLSGEAGISLSQAHIMSALDGSYAYSQRHVALALRQTEANVSRQLRTMKMAGLVTIAKNKKDGRQRDVRLTAKGKAKYQKAQTALKKLDKSLASSEASALKFAAESLVITL